MATIRTVFAPGQTLNLLDPNSWVGGVVPGPNDIAQVGENGNYRTQINMSTPYNIYDPIGKNQGNAILPWEGNDVTIRVDSNNTNYNSEYIYPDTNGSFIVYALSSYPRIGLPIKIDYVSKSLDTNSFFYSCSVDYSYGSNWTYNPDTDLYCATITPEGFYSESFGIIIDNNYVYPLETKFELTGSQVWHVGQIETLERCHLTIKDNAHLKLDGTTVNPNAIYNNQDSYYNVIRILDNSTIETTGSVQRSNAGFFYYNTDGYNRVQISGSDLCPNTRLSSSAQIGDTTIVVDDTTGFGEGSIISISNNVEDQYYYGASLDLSKPIIFQNQNYIMGHSTGSRVETYVTTGFATSSFEDMEVVQIISSSGNELTVASIYGKKGKVHEDLGLYDYESFVQTFGGVLDYYTGNKRAILVKSLHKNFKKGDKLAFNKSLITECVFDDYYLSSSRFIDYNNGDNVENSIHQAPYRLTSSIAIPGEIYDNTSIRPVDSYNEYFNYNNNITQSFKTGLSGGLTGSLHLRTDNDYIVSNNNPQTRWHGLITQSFFDEGEITVKFSLFRDLTGSYDGSALIALGVGPGGLLRHGATWSTEKPRSVQRQIGWDFEAGRYLDVWGSGNNRLSRFYTQYFMESGSGNSTPNVNDPRDPKEWVIKLHNKQGRVEYFCNDKRIDAAPGVITPGPISLSMYRYVNVFSIDIKQYYQLLLLDTEEEINSGDDILEGIGLKYNHPKGQKVRTNANQVKNPLSFEDITKDFWYNKDEATVFPYQHGATSNVATNGNYYNYYRNRITDNYGQELALTTPKMAHTISYSYAKNGAGFYVIYDFQQPISMSALSLQHYYDYSYDYTEMAGENIQIDVSNNITDWTTVYGPTPDPRYTTKQGQRRYYEFTSGSVTAQFVKLYLNGNSRRTDNRLSDVGVYNFYDENNQYRGNTIELYNADMFNIGDRILLINNKVPEPASGWNDSYRMGGTIDWSESTLPNVSDRTDDEVAGGMSPIATITSINGNKITLDRKLAYSPVSKDTLVYKWNQGGINFKGNPKNIQGFYVYNQYRVSNPYQLINATFDYVQYNSDFRWALGGRNQSFYSQIENVSLDIKYSNRPAYLLNHIIKNNLVIGGSYIYLGHNFDTSTIPNYDTVAFNNVYLYQPDNMVIGSSQSFFTGKSYFIYNTIYKSRENSYTIPTQGNSGDIFRRFYSFPKIKIAHNYVGTTDYGLGFGINQFMDWYTGESLKNIKVYDNYYGNGRGAFYNYSNMSLNNTFYKNYSNAINNPNFELHTNSYSLTSNTLVESYRHYYGYLQIPLLNIDRPILNPFDLELKQPVVHNFTAENIGVSLLKESPSLFKMIVVNPYAYNAGKRNRSPLNIYKLLFILEEEQTIQIQCDFDYQLLKDTSQQKYPYNASQQNAGYFNNEWVRPNLLLIDSTSYIILDSEPLLSQSFTSLSYDKTLTLPAGEYAFGLTKDNGATDYQYWTDLLNHSPIDIKMFSTNPDKLFAYYNSFDAYKLFDNPGHYYPTNDYTSYSNPQSRIKRSNSIPVGKLKLRKIKL